MQDKGRKFLEDVSKLIEEYWERTGVDYDDVHDVAVTEFRLYLMSMAWRDGRITPAEARVVSDYFGENVTPSDIEGLQDMMKYSSRLPLSLVVAVQIDNEAWHSGKRDTCIAAELIDLYKTVGEKMVRADDALYGINGEAHIMKAYYHETYVDIVTEYFRQNDKLAKGNASIEMGLLGKLKNFWAKKIRPSKSAMENQDAIAISNMSIAKIRFELLKISKTVSADLIQDDCDEETAEGITKTEIAAYMTYISAFNGRCQKSEADIISEILGISITSDEINEAVRNNKEYYDEFGENIPISIKVLAYKDNVSWDEGERELVNCLTDSLFRLYWAIGRKIVNADGTANAEKKDTMDRYLKMLCGYIWHEDKLAVYLKERQKARDNGASATPVKSGVTAPRKR